MRESFLRNNVHCHIWEKKELENYLLNPDLLYRSYVWEAKRKKAKLISSDEFSELLTRLTADFYNDVFAQRLSHQLGSAASDPKQVKQFKDGFDKNWENMDYRFKVIGGKDYLSGLNSELMDSLKLSITTSNILRHMRKDEIDPELVSLIEEVNKAFEMY